MLLRCTGRILRLDNRSGVSATTGKAWNIPTVHVLVENQGVAEVNVPDIKFAQIDAGQDIDWLVEVGTSGRFLSVRFVSDLQPLGLAYPVSESA
jgi:hypothetical protein